LIHGLTKIELQTLHVAIFKTQGLKFYATPEIKRNYKRHEYLAFGADEKMRFRLIALL
jgi:hypothetical protein